MLKNKWMILCLLLGLIISVSLISSIPMYSQGILQKMLIKELELYQQDNNKYPGNYSISFTYSDDQIRSTMVDLRSNGDPVFKDKKVLNFYKQRLESFKAVDEYVSEKAPGFIGLPVLSKAITYSTDTRKMISEDKPDSSQYTYLESISDIEKHVTIIDGRLPQKTLVDGVYEALISEWAIKRMNVVIGNTYTLLDSTNEELEPIKVKPVGVITIPANNQNDYYWSLLGEQSLINERFIIDENLMREYLINTEPTMIFRSTWRYAFDYRAMNIGNLGSVVSGHNRISRSLKGAVIYDPSLEVIMKYFETAKQLKNLLWVLNVPVIFMLLLYLFMISRLIIDRERNEIALLSSRGSTRLQIVAGYLVEGLVLGGIALIVGPFIGLLTSKILGSSNGFLEFVNRKAIVLSLDRDAYLYAILGIIVSLITMLVPAYSASNTSIVSHKQRAARGTGHALWEKLFLDFVLLIVAGFGYYIFTQRQDVILVTGASAADIKINPLLFIIPTLFIIGASLLFLRLYPYLIKGIYQVGRKAWSPSAYATLVQVGRTFKSYHFLVVFLIMTLSIGIFSATAARTINRNMEEKVQYSVGCDIVAQEIWESDSPPSNGPSGMGSSSQMSGSNSQGSTRITFFEPPFSRFAQLSGVEYATKVYNNEKAYVETNDEYAENVKLMGIESYDFGKVNWFRTKLLPYHINEYLNLLTSEQSACLVSRSLSQQCNIKVGDYVQIGLSGIARSDGTGRSQGVTFTVYGIVDYWPSWNPNTDPSSAEKKNPMLVVTNLQYVQDHLGLNPYEVWLKLKPDATSKQVYDAIEDKNINLMALTDAKQQLIKAKSSPFRLAINGVLTLGFIISGIICLLGFLIYWILSINSRVLQFGIFRAMGLSVRKLISMIICEQILTSGAAIISGIYIGLISSKIFVPFFQLVFDAYSQVPPFKVISYVSDRIKIYILISFTLVIGLAILGFLISRIKISQAIKLGEE